MVNISSASVEERPGDRDREFKTLAKYVCPYISSITERPFEGEGKEGKVRILKNM